MSLQELKIEERRRLKISKVIEHGESIQSVFSVITFSAPIRTDIPPSCIIFHQT